MTTDSDIELSGPFQAKDSNGRTLDVKAIRIFDEGYGIIDVYVEFAARLDPGAYKDTVLVRQIIDRLRSVGYKGPDFGHSDPGLQESRLIVLEAPEEFAAFAKSRGWKNRGVDTRCDGRREAHDNRVRRCVRYKPRPVIAVQSGVFAGRRAGGS